MTLTTDDTTEILFNTFPIGYKRIIAQMIAYDIKNLSIDETGEQLKSENIGTYSYQLADGGMIMDSSGYPKSLISALKKIQQPRFK